MIVLRDYQKRSIERCISYVKRNPKNHPLIALPTGAGKSYVISGVINQLVNDKPDINILVISHVREILEQDYESIKHHTGLDIGIYSKGLKKQEIRQITVAGIQSIFRHPEYFSKFSFIIIDECHLIAPGNNTMYRKFFAALPEAVYFGVTATPFRLGSGYIYGQPDSMFSDLIYDLTSRDKFNELIEQGYLCKLRTQGTSIEFEAEGIKTTAGDFDKKELSNKFNRSLITSKAVQEIIHHGKDRKKWLVFAIDIEHAESIAEELSNNGITTMVIHSKVDFDRSAIINGFKSGIFKCIVNVNVLTTGFDDPEIDLIALLRPTKSPVVHIQTIGRGLRIAPGKEDCLILDFAGNTARLGAINDISIRKPKKGMPTGEPITKRCPTCDAIHFPSVKVCEYCGHKFLMKTMLEHTAGSSEILADGKERWVTVTDIAYALHKKTNSPSMMKVTYECGLRIYNEFICIEHSGYSKYKAIHWLKFRGLPDIATAINAVHNSSKLKVPHRILIDKSGKYPVIKDYSF